MDAVHTNVIKRNGEEVNFDLDKIVNAINAANKEVDRLHQLNDYQVQAIADNIAKQIEIMTHAIHVEDIQDMVETGIMEMRGNEVAQIMVVRRHCGLPHHALLHLAVAEHNVGHIVLMVQSPRHGHAHADRKAVAQRAAADVNAGCLVHIRVPLQNGVVLAQGGEMLGVEEPPARQRRIQRRAGVALGEHKAVAILPPRVLRVDPHDVKVERGDHVHRGE